VDADGNVIDSFRYNDLAPWPTDADGNGPSIVRNDPASDLDPSLAANWTTGLVDGTPGTPDGNVFSGDPLADLDGDGYVAIIEYAQGLSDTVFSAGQHIDASGTETIAGITYPTVSYREDPNALGVNLSIETTDLLTPSQWQDGSTSLTFVETVNDPDGIPRHTYRLNIPVTSAPKQFYRIKLEY